MRPPSWVAIRAASISPADGGDLSVPCTANTRDFAQCLNRFWSSGRFLAIQPFPRHSTVEMRTAPQNQYDNATACAASTSTHATTIPGLLRIARILMAYLPTQKKTHALSDLT